MARSHQPAAVRSGKVVLFVLIGLVLAVLAVGIFLFPVWRAGRQMETAYELRDLGQRTEAAEAARKALDMRAEYPDAHRFLAYALMESSPEEAYGHLDALVRMGEASWDDRKAFVRLAQNQRELDRARIILDELMEQGATSDADVLALSAGQIRLERGDPDHALRRAEEALAINPDQPRALLLKGSILLQRPDPVERIQSKQALLRAGESGTAEGLEALLLLAGATGLPITRDERLEIADKLLTHPLASTASDLLAFRISYALQPEEREAVIERAIARIAEENRAALGEFLNSVGRPDRTLELIGAEEAVADSDLYRVRLSALLLLQQNDEAVSMLTADDVPIPELARSTMLSQVLDPAQEANRDRINEEWERAFTLAAEELNPAAALVLARQAMSRGQTGKAYEAFRLAFQDEGIRIQASIQDWEQFFGATLVTAGLEEGLEVALRFQEVQPDYMLNRNNVAYLNLLLNQSVDESVAEAADLVRRRPEVTGFKTTLALGYLRQGKPQEAHAVLTGIDVDWESQTGSNRAIYAAVLNAVGQREEAVSLASTIREGSVFAPEWELVAPLVD